MITMRVFKCTLPAHSGILAPSTALRFASTAMKDDREVVLVACNKNGLALGYAPAALQADREVVLAACNESGGALEHASAALQADREVVLAACNQWGFALRHASAALKDDREVVMVGIAQNYRVRHRAVHHASSALQAEFNGEGILTHVRNQLRLRSSFFCPFLCAINAPEKAAALGGARCLLPRLDIGEEKPIQQMIAAFTGVPIGSSWRCVQLATAHPLVPPPFPVH